MAAVPIRRREFDLDGLLDALAEKITARLRPESSPMPRLLTLREAGAMLGRSADAMQKLVARGEIRVIRTGRRIHITREDLDDWIARNRE